MERIDGIDVIDLAVAEIIREGKIYSPDVFNIMINRAETIRNWWTKIKKDGGIDNADWTCYNQSR